MGMLVVKLCYAYSDVDSLVSGLGDLDKRHLKPGKVQNSLYNGIHNERFWVSRYWLWGITKKIARSEKENRKI
jgi:hypothetical protein